MNNAAIAHDVTEIDVTALKCGCCKARMQKFEDLKEKVVSAELFRRPCSCVDQHKCFICGKCLDHCACGQRFYID